MTWSQRLFLCLLPRSILLCPYSLVTLKNTFFYHAFLYMSSFQENKKAGAHTECDTSARMYYANKGLRRIRALVAQRIEPLLPMTDRASGLPLELFDMPENITHLLST